MCARILSSFLQLALAFGFCGFGCVSAQETTKPVFLKVNTDIFRFLLENHTWGVKILRPDLKVGRLPQPYQNRTMCQSKHELPFLQPEQIGWAITFQGSKSLTKLMLWKFLHFLCSHWAKPQNHIRPERNLLIRNGFKDLPTHNHKREQSYIKAPHFPF